MRKAENGIDRGFLEAYTRQLVTDMNLRLLDECGEKALVTGQMLWLQSISITDYRTERKGK